jgi:hypothetical protein
VCSGAGLLWIGVQWLESRRTPEGFSLWFGLVPIALALLLAMRRILFDRCLVLDDDHMILPTGLLQTGTTRIEYKSIKRVWRHYLPMAVVLRVATSEGIFEIVSALLPDNESYRTLEEFLSLKAQENAGQNIKTV